MSWLTETIEEIILRYSSRGMTYLAPALPEDYCTKAAQEINSWERGKVLLLTGFSVNGAPETDGPPGTFVMARALSDLGFTPIVVSEQETCAFFEPYGIETRAVSSADGPERMGELLAALAPQGIISIERCGRNARGRYCNMRGFDISSKTSPIDELVIRAARKDIPTVGVGDGGNEIGMGNVAPVIAEKLTLDPCAVSVDCLVIATVSNWGAYGIVEALSRCAGKQLLPEFSQIKSFYEDIVNQGCVDGISGKREVRVDGFTMEVERSIVERLRAS